MDIKSGSGYPASALSNFAPHPFTFDGVEVASMEGLLQAFKFDKVHIQDEVCKLVGLKAKLRGKMRNWQERQTLYWRDKEYPRKSQAYQDLLDRAYQAMCDQNEGFRKALLASGDAVIQHSIGRANAAETVLTKNEFCGRLTRLRSELRDQRNTRLSF